MADGGGRLFMFGLRILMAARFFKMDCFSLLAADMADAAAAEVEGAAGGMGAAPAAAEEDETGNEKGLKGVSSRARRELAR